MVKNNYTQIVESTLYIYFIASAVVVFLFMAGRWFTGDKRPQFPPKVDVGGPSYRLQASHIVSHVDWPSRTFRPARQDAVLPRRMTTTALIISEHFSHLCKCLNLRKCINLDFRTICFLAVV